MAVDLNLVRHALTVARDSDFASVELEAPNISFSAHLTRAARPPRPAAAAAEEDAAESARFVRSTLVGYFGFGNPPVKVGDSVAEGDVVGVITALGIPSDVVCEVPGTVEQILVSEGAPVEFGQPLLKVAVS